ncbi:hypothetical protein TL16_g01612 [Triparma laevis f. inornata]|uniref:Serine/threonine-protein phosphatase PGAM5, mitochondrial n=2 Tax=Triparma laevis TaxID=1534972 RepID=A0A9W7FR94_9STRA|nr:hypothetical protein TL16_g01612 [Triparma laevis f. inornata]GMI16621.1 hypothetical protein TrLO_g15640 [Triparma laevis f. longispina]
MFARHALRSSSVLVGGVLGVVGGGVGIVKMQTEGGFGGGRVASCDDSGSGDKETYYNFPTSQKFNPKVEYPLWDHDWDGKKEVKAPSRSKGVTRHIIMVRHGQYDETFKEDEKRILTPLGREQAAATGKRILELMNNVGGVEGGKINVKLVHSSAMARAVETCDIIVDEIQKGGEKVVRTEPDEGLNEGRPCHVIPYGSKCMSEKAILKDGPRIEGAYKKYFWRETKTVEEGEGGVEGKVKEKGKGEEGGVKTSQMVEEESRGRLDSVISGLIGGGVGGVGGGGGGGGGDNPAADATVAPPPSNHEFEIIVCHGNVIRYFFMRALQLPPEAWLRLCTFNCSLAYFTVRCTGGVSCRSLGDIGHLEPRLLTFSGHHGLNW